MRSSSLISRARRRCALASSSRALSLSLSLSLSLLQVKIFGPDADAWKAALFSYIDHAQLPTDLGGTALSMAERPPGYFPW